MQCPYCHAPLDPRALTCDHCHAWVTPARRIKARRTEAKSPPAEPLPPDEHDQAHLVTKLVTLDVERERPTRLVDVPVPAVVKRLARQKARSGRKAGSAGPHEDEEPLLYALQQQLSAYFARMHPGDRRTSWALGLALLGVFLPWMHVPAYGLVSGLEGPGLPSLGAAAIGLVCLHRRTSRQRLHNALLTLQIVASALLVGMPAYLVIAGVLQRAHVGVAVTVLGGLAALPLSLARLAGR